MNFAVNEMMRLANSIGRWADGVIPNRTPADAIKKLSMEEVPELWRSLKDNDGVDEGEIADVLILALDVCYMSGIDPLTAINNKMEINRKRTWKFEHGVMQHMEEKYDGPEVEPWDTVKDGDET